MESIVKMFSALAKGLSLICIVKMFSAIPLKVLISEPHAYITKFEILVSSQSRSQGQGKQFTDL